MKSKKRTNVDLGGVDLHLGDGLLVEEAVREKLKHGLEDVLCGDGRDVRQKDVVIPHAVLQVLRGHAR